MKKNPTKEEGARHFEEWWADTMANPEVRRVYEEEAPKTDLWLALSDARFAAGLTQAEVAERMGVSQAQVARIEAHGYDRHSLNTLRRYVKALGSDFKLEVTIRIPDRLKGKLEQPNPLVATAGEPVQGAAGS